MARPLRVEFPGAVYHVIVRGNAKQDIFLTDHDRGQFTFWLARAVELHNIIIHAYCLMGNHFHLLVETPDGNLSVAMHGLNSNYAQYFNAHHNRVGHLLQGRYKSFVVEKNSYLLELARYIVLNPVRAGIAAHPRDWVWSNYKATSGCAKSPSWLCIDDTLHLFSQNKQTALREYRQFVKKGIGGKNPHDKAAHGFILGDLDFIYSIWEQTSGAEDVKEFPREERIIGRPSLKEIFDGMRANKEDRDSAIVFARGRCGYLASEIAKELGLDRSTVAKIYRKEV